MTTLDVLLRFGLPGVLVALLAWALFSSPASQQTRKWPVPLLIVLLVLYAGLFVWAMTRRAQEFGRSSGAGTGVAR